MKFKNIFFVVSVLLFVGCASTSNEKIEGSVRENVKINVPEYVSNYKPLECTKIPVIRLVSESGSNDFLSKPVDGDISATKQSWGGYRGEPAPWYEKCELTLEDGNEQILLDGVEAKVKVRGNWTSNYPKKPLKIKFEKKQSMLGLNDNAKMKEWVLLASYKDWSFLRDSTAYYISHLISPNYTSDFCLVDLYSNGAYQGVYVLAEQQEISEKRINITKNPKDYKGVDIGYLIELDDHSKKSDRSFKIKYGHSLNDFNGKPVKNFTQKYSIKSDINTDYQQEFIDDYMNNLWKLCYEAVYNRRYYKFDEYNVDLEPSKAKSCYECISSVIDLESLVDTYILHEICCDADIYLTSFYMDIDFGENGSKKLKFEAPWDWDSALGNKKFCTDSQGLFAGVNGWDVDHSKMGYGNPWFLIFINCNWFQKMVRQKWEYIHNQDVIGKVTAHIDFVTATYEKNFTANYALWKNAGKSATLGNELCPAAGRCRNQKQAAEYLKDWLIKRFAALDEIFL